MEHETIFLDVLTISDRMRHLDPAKVESIAASMSALGLQQPISIWVSEDGSVVELVAGAHRVAAAKSLGWEKIDSIIVDLDALDRQLWQIDENLMRADLGPAEMAQHLKRRKELWEKRSGRTSPTAGGGAPGENTGFAKDTEGKTGTPKRTTNQGLARANSIPADVLGKIEGTDLDKGTYLDKLKKLPRDEMRAKVDLDLEIGWRERKTRRTSEEITLDKFDHTIRSISNICSWLPKIDVPDLDSKRRSQAVADLRNAIKHIQETIEIIQRPHEVPR